MRISGARPTARVYRYSEAMPLDITTGAQTLTAAGVVTGTLDISALTAIPTIKLDVQGLTEGATARIAIEDTQNTSEFSDSQTVCVFDVEGPIGKGDVELSVTPDLIPSLRYGATYNQLRAHLLRLTGSSPSVTLHAYTD